MADAYDERESLLALKALAILDTAPEAIFDGLVSAASRICGTPISLISLLDADRQWFKANVGLPGVTETARGVAFCAHAVLGADLFEVPDAANDPRFSSNPLVLGDPSIRFYAGMPLSLADGSRIGTLCVIDRQPRTLTIAQRESLRSLAAATVQALQWRRATFALREAHAALVEERQRLRLSEDFLDRTGKLAGVGGWQLDLTTSQIHWSDETCRIHGLPVGHVPTLDEAFAFYPPDAQTAVRRAVERCVQTGEPWDLELELVRADGRRIWARTVGSAEFADGKATHLVGVFQDISAAVRQRRALVDANESISIATSSGGIGIWQFHLQTRAVQWDAQMYRLYGLRSEGILDTYAAWAATLPPESLAVIRDGVADAVAGVAPFDVEFDAIWPDGSRHSLRSAARVGRDAAGEATHLTGATWDVTETRRMASALHAQGRLAAAQASLATAANESPGLVSALQTSLSLLCAHTGWEVGHVYLPSGDTPSRLVPSQIWNLDKTHSFKRFQDQTAETSFAAGLCLLGRVYLGREPSTIDALTAENFVRYESAAACGLRRALAAPVLAGREVVAIMEFFSTESGPFDAAEVALVSYAGVQIGRVVDRHRAQMALQSQTVALRQQSVVDELTGLYNRRGFLEHARHQMSSGQHVYIVFADLDGMKQINDTLGHEAGDAALIATASILRAALRDTDFIARLGGDEFVALTLETGAYDAGALLGRLDAAVVTWNATHQSPFCLAVSFGVSGPAADGEPIEELLKRADDAMYAMKAARRRFRGSVQPEK